MLIVNERLSLPLAEIELSAVRAQGAGGQNVNKVSSAVHLRFDIRASSLPEACKERMLALRDQRITRQGLVVIKAQQERNLEQNRAAALERLAELIRRALHVPVKRRATKPTYGSKLRRLEGKARQSKIKAMRRQVTD